MTIEGRAQQFVLLNARRCLPQTLAREVLCARCQGCHLKQKGVVKVAGCTEKSRSQNVSGLPVGTPVVDGRGRRMGMKLVI